MPKLKILTKRPLELGFNFPAEWEKQEATWFSWPRPEGISFPGKYHTIPANIAAIIKVIAEYQKVYINVPNENYEYIVRGHLKEAEANLKQVKFFYIKTNENWCRDHGPAFVINKKGQRAIVDWGFNAWGGKYPPYDSDDAVPTEIAKAFKLPVFYPTKKAKTLTDKIKKLAGKQLELVIMEGGAVEFNGAGTVLTTTDCLLNENRNPDLTKEEIEQYLKDYYGQKNVCWLEGGIVGDDTDGHIDDLARFLSPTKLVMAIEENKKDKNYRILKSARKQAEELRDQDGNPFEIVEIPMPDPVIHDGERLPATYINFLFINDACLVPTFGSKAKDKKAIEILQQHLPRHKVIGINCRELIWGLGAIHCLTQQMPAKK